MITTLAIAVAVAVTQAAPAVAKAAGLQPDLEVFRKKYCDMLQFSSAACKSKHLRLQQMLPVDIQMPEGKLFELSGLALVSGKLLGVNDKNDPTLYQITISGKKSRAVPVLEVNPQDPTVSCEGKPFDFEGIVPDGDGFVIINETCSKVVTVAKDGTAAVMPLEYVPEQTPTIGNGFESVAIDAAKNRLYVIKERQPRIFYEYDRSTGKLLRQFSIPSIIANADGSEITIPRPQGGNPWVYNVDVADALVEGSFLYALERNSNSILKIDLEPAQPKLVDFVSYVGSGVDSLYATGEPFGLAEGLAMDGARLYLASDNNSKPTVADSKDTRSRLFLFKRPKGF